MIVCSYDVNEKGFFHGIVALRFSVLSLSPFTVWS